MTEGHDPAEPYSGPTTGDTLTHFVLGEKLGEGGGGVVYAATDLHLGREVALKLLPLDPSDGDYTEAKDRLMREARYAARVHHASIATIFEVGIEGDIVFIAMELIKGRTLRRVMRRGPLRLGDIVRVARQVAEAMKTAHAAGLVHRDLKPENVMLTESGAVKLLDFGLAKRAKKGRPGAGMRTADLTLSDGETSMEGSVSGTPGYIAPEVLEGNSFDQRADIFSFGALLYEMVTGSAAFGGESAFEKMLATARDTPPPMREYRDDVPAALESIVHRCLQKDPAFRYAAFDDLCGELRRLDPTYALLDEGVEDTVSDQAPARTMTDEGPEKEARSHPSLTAVDANKPGLLVSGDDSVESAPAIKLAPPTPEPVRTPAEELPIGGSSSSEVRGSSRRTFLAGAAVAVGAVAGASLLFVKGRGPTSVTALSAELPVRVGVPRTSAEYFVFGIETRGLVTLLNQAVLESLFTINNRGRLSTTILAKHEVEDGGRRLRLRLRDDVWFHPHACFEGGAKTEGRLATAKDLVRSIEIVSRHGPFGPPIVGLKEAGEHIPGVEHNGDDVVVTFDGETPFAREFLAPIPLFPVELERYTKLPSLDMPVGTGPFRASGPISRSTVSLERNPRYRIKGPGGGTLPRAAELLLHDTDDVLLAFAGCERGELDLFRIDPRQRAQIADLDEHGGVVLKPQYRNRGVRAVAEIGDSSTGVGYLVMPQREGSPYGDVRVREAVACAIDRAALSEPAQLSPSGALLEGRLLGALPKSEVHHQDLDRARALLAEAGHPEGRGLRPLRVRGRYGIAEMLRTQLHEVGIEIEFVEDVRGGLDPRIELYASGWTGPVFDGRDPGPTLVSIAHELAPLVPELREVDPARMLLEPRLEPRVELYKAFHRNLLESFRVLPYGHVNPQRSSDVWLVRDGVEGMVDEATGLIVDVRLEQVWRRS